MSLLELFCDVDDFWKAFQPHWYKQLLRRCDMQRVRLLGLSPSEIMTLLIPFHMDNEFPSPVSYNRFAE